MPRAFLAEKLGREIVLYVDLLIVFPIPPALALEQQATASQATATSAFVLAPG